MKSLSWSSLKVSCREQNEKRRVSLKRIFHSFLNANCMPQIFKLSYRSLFIGHSSNSFSTTYEVQTFSRGRSRVLVINSCDIVLSTGNLKLEPQFKILGQE